MVLPVPLSIEMDNGQKDSLTLPAEIWHRGGSWTFHYPSTTSIKSITIDPNHDYPDIDPSNNTLSGKPKKPIPAGTTANDVINKYITAIGGADKINGIKDYYYTATGTVQGQNIKFTREYKLPGKMLLLVDVPAMNMTAQKLVVNGDSITSVAMGQPAPIDEASRKRYLETTAPIPEINFSKPGYNLQLAPALDEVDGKDAYVITATYPSGTVSKKYYDVQTGLKLKDELITDEGISSFVFSDYRDLNGIMIPYKQTVNQQFEIILNVTDAKINSGLKDEDFK